MGSHHEEAFEEAGVKLVDYGEADIISIATPDEFHGSMTIEALSKGKHVFCEKPLCRKREELDTIRAFADLHVGQNYPLRDRFAFMKAFDVGNVQRCEATYIWGRHAKLKTTWRKDDPNYSLILGGMIHVVDLAYFILDEEMHLDSVAWSGEVPEIVYALCQIRTGIVEFCMDGAPGDKQHAHGFMISGDLDSFAARNNDPTDKKACLRAFIDDIKSGKRPENDFRAVDLCLQIESSVATSRSR